MNASTTYNVHISGREVYTVAPLCMCLWSSICRCVTSEWRLLFKKKLPRVTIYGPEQTYFLLNHAFPNPPKLDCSISMCVGIDEECNLCLDYQDGDPGAIIALSPPGVIHRVLGLLPPIVTIPPDINPPPAVPLQQGKTSSTFSGGFSVMQCSVKDGG